MFVISNLFTYVIILVLVILAIYLRKKGTPFYGINTNIIQILANVAVILTLVFAVFSYTHNIYPVFEKEKRLKEIEKKLTETETEFIKQTENLKDLEKTIKSQTKIIDGQNFEINLQENDKIELEKLIKEKENKMAKLEEKITNVEREIVLAYLLNEMYQIMNTAIDHNTLHSKDKFNLREYTLKEAERGLCYEEKDGYKYKAFLCLKEYAQVKLTDQDYDSKAILNVIDYYYDKYYFNE